MDVLVLIDKLDDPVHNAKADADDRLRCGSTRRRSSDILDQMRATIPEEIKQARWIVKERQEILAEPLARPSGSSKRRPRASGEPSSARRRSPSRPSAPPRKHRRGCAARESAAIRLGAEDYADEILNTLEVNLSKFIAAVHCGTRAPAGKDEPAEVASRHGERRGSQRAFGLPDFPGVGSARELRGCEVQAVRPGT